MFDKNYLLPLDALGLIQNALSEAMPAYEYLAIEECYGRVIASDVISPEDLPAFPRSTVDGYALNSADTFGAKENTPAYITVRNEVFMGAPADFIVCRGEAAKVPTGGMIPSGADAVLMLEHAQIASDDLIEAMHAVAPGENVIQVGEDIKKGLTVLPKGHRLRAQDIGALAGLGITSMDVFRRPVVAIISTGDEIVPPQNALRAGQIRDINSFTLAGLIAAYGAVPVKKGIFRDDYDVIKKAVEEALQDSDMVLISGGTSAGIKDMTAQIINDIGKPGVLFHGVSLKPGKPLIGGVANNKPIFGLPGHPAATVVSFDIFIRPVIQRLSGFNTEKIFPKTVMARMTKNIASAAGREDHIRVCIEKKDNELLAVPVLGKSGLITTLVKADGVVVITNGRLGLEAGQEVVVNLF